MKFFRHLWATLTGTIAVVLKDIEGIEHIAYAKEDKKKSYWYCSLGSYGRVILHKDGNVSMFGVYDTYIMSWKLYL